MRIALSDFEELLVVTGAGISVASGIRPFRGPGGWWTEHPGMEREAASQGLLKNPQRVWEIYGPLRPLMHQAQPNAAHRALARLENEAGKKVTILTQNVDGLHQRAGSRNVIEYHGSMLRSRCSACDLPPFDDPAGGPRPCPRCGEWLRPDIVLFGEMIPEQACLAGLGAVLRCDLFLAIGTSGTVAPASGLVQRADSYGVRTLLVNLEPSSPPNPCFHQEILGKAEELLPDLFAWPA